MPPTSVEHNTSLLSGLLVLLSSLRSWHVFHAKSSTLTALNDIITTGHLKISDSGKTYSYGERQEGCRGVRLTVVNEGFWLRIFVSGDLGFGEAYMAGDVQVSSLKDFMDLWLDNRSRVNKFPSSIWKLYSVTSGLYNGIFGQTYSQARLNAIASYDQSNELFKAFLSQEMMYSCALWSEEEGGVRGDLGDRPFPSRDLEVAQKRKIHHVLRKARVKPGHRVLEFGSGWGGLAIEAVKTHDCQVDTLTLSIEQKTLAEDRIREAGLEDRIRVHLLDYRKIPAEFENAFDAFVSIEMIEHVGPRYYNTYFKLVDFALKSKDAAVVITSSTLPESRYTDHQPEDFARRYIWPNTSMPSATILITSMKASSQGRFTLEGVENHAAHYPRTLREWDRRFEANVTQDLFVRDYSSTSDRDAEYEIFKRKWRYLFAYASAGFAKGWITCHMITFIRADDSPSNPCD